MSLGKKALKGFFWATFERFGIQGVSFVIFVILARLLTPTQFGLIGMLTIFIAISRTLTNSGFSQALIQKKDADESDFSSVFYMNLLVSVIIYLVLFIAAPLIADFYKEPALIALTRVLGLKFVIDAFSLIQETVLTKEVDFKSLMIARLPSNVIGGIAGISAALGGLGVWSLIIHQLVDSLAYSIQVWIQSPWRPHWKFDPERLKELFHFGSRLMASALINTTFQNLYLVVIGRFFTTAEVGLYDQANKIRKLPVQNISSALDRVTFPVLSEIQNDDKRLKRAYRSIIRQVLFFMGPIMMLGLVMAEPLFRLVLTEKWLPAVPYFQWLCITGLFHPLNAYNLNILKVKGRSDLYLRLEILKKAIEVIGIVIAMNFSVLILVVAQTAQSLIAFFINSYYSGRFINYGLAEQFKDVWSIFFSAIAMALGVYFMNTQITNLADVLIIGSDLLAGVIVYIMLLALIDRPVLTNLKSVAENFIVKS